MSLSAESKFLDQICPFYAHFSTDKYFTGGISKIVVGEEVKYDLKWINILQVVKFYMDAGKNGKNIL